MKPPQVAALLIAPLLSGFASYASFDPAAAEPIAASAAAPAAAAAAATEHPRVYLFRGFAGVVFSRGTDKLADEIEQAGFTATVNEAVMCPVVVKQAIADYRTDPEPIVVIGHSVGAACALKFSDMLGAENIPVSLLVTTDPAKIAENVPANVERYINVFQSNSMLGGRDVMPGEGFQGHYASYDILKHTEITHINMEKNESIHQQILSKIQQLAETPAKAQGEAVPIRYVVPADAAIELWDSGMPVFAHPGDTLQTLAMFYHVPPWSLAQINSVSDAAPLPPGQRIIVPRHLLPFAALGDSSAATALAPPKP